MTIIDYYYGVERQEVLPLIPDDARTILDIGCGNGATMALVKQKFPQVRLVGVELNKSVAACS